MADNTVKIWTINELMKRYGINRASMTEYVKAKINIINKDDIHAKKAGKEWQFDAEAVRILDELRGYGVVVENYDSPEKAEIAELKKELEEARKFMAAAQAENSRQKDKIIELLENEKSNIRLLSAAESDLKIAEADKERQQKQIEEQTEEFARLKAELENERKARLDAEAKAEAEAKKSWWDKLWSK